MKPGGRKQGTGSRGKFPSVTSVKSVAQNNTHKIMQTTEIQSPPIHPSFPFPPGDEARGCELRAARQREARLYNEMTETAREALAAASTMSVHHNWLDHVCDFLATGCTEHQCYFDHASKLDCHLARIHREGHALYDHEERRCRDVSRALIAYANVLKALREAEVREYAKVLRRQNELSFAN